MEINSVQLAQNGLVSSVVVVMIDRTVASLRNNSEHYTVLCNICMIKTLLLEEVLYSTSIRCTVLDLKGMYQWKSAGKLISMMMKVILHQGNLVAKGALLLTWYAQKTKHK